MRPDLIEEALQAINLFELRRTENRELNEHITRVYPEFTPHIFNMDDISEASFVKLLDAILHEAGHELASYYLYECQNSDGTNSRRVIEKDGTEWPLTNIIELATYVYRNKKRGGRQFVPSLSVISDNQ